MKYALDEAQKSGIDVPVGCVIEKNGQIIASEHNKREINKDVFAHAEILALSAASKRLNHWKLKGCNIYVTLEPCPMCAWAILNSNAENVYFGAYDTMYGAFGSRLNLAPISNNKINAYGGIMEDECSFLIKNYFKSLRNKNERNI